MQTWVREWPLFIYVQAVIKTSFFTVFAGIKPGWPGAKQVTTGAKQVNLSRLAIAGLRPLGYLFFFIWRALLVDNLARRAVGTRAKHRAGL